MSLWYQKNVYVSCTEEFWNCRKYGNTGTELYCWRADWWYYCSCEDYRYIYGDNKNTGRTLLETMSKGVREKRATKKALSLNKIRTIPLLVIRNIFHNIFNPAVEYLTEPVQNNGLYHHILPEPLKLCFVNTMVLNELVLTDVFIL